MRASNLRFRVERPTLVRSTPLRPDPIHYSRHLTPEETQQPLSAEISQAKCIQSADAYYTLTEGKADATTDLHLLNVVYTAYFIDDMMEQNCPLELFRVAETALRECEVNGGRTGKFEIPGHRFCVSTGRVRLRACISRWHPYTANRDCFRRHRSKHLLNPTWVR